ncbi:MAG: hypothetical protein IPI87_09890 [Betaproteobacteria bacterium]|nr:hypothetical protein [Betaproteobacteria bacterium]
MAALFAASLVAAFAIAVALNAGPRLHGTPASIDVPGSAMHAPKGRARIEGSTIVLNALGADGVGLIVAPVPAFDADEYSRVTWHIASEAARGTDLLMVWRTREQPGRTHTASIDWSRGPATVDLSRDPDWSGSIQGVALAVRGQLPVPLAIAGFSARSNAWDATAADIVGQWLEWPRTGGRMTITQMSGEARHVAPILAVVAAGVALGVAFLIFRARKRSEPVAAWAIAALFLAGWLVVDLRWQTILWRQHAATVAQFAGKSLDEQRMADVDAPIFDVARKIRDATRARGGRILVLSDSAHLRTRVGWFLYPENVFYGPRGRDPPPAPDRLRPGDQVVLLLFRGIQWDATRGMLVWADGRTRAAREILSDGPDFAMVEIL